MVGLILDGNLDLHRETVIFNLAMTMMVLMHRGKMMLNTRECKQKHNRNHKQAKEINNKRQRNEEKHLVNDK